MSMEIVKITIESRILQINQFKNGINNFVYNKHKEICQNQLQIL